MNDDQQLDETMRRTLEAGPADPEVVALEQRLSELTRAEAPLPEVVAVKQQLFQRYYPALLERSARLDRARFKVDVFFESYLRRLIALGEELGYAARPPVAMAHLLLAGILHQARGEPEAARLHLAALRQLVESGQLDLAALDDAVVARMTESINAIARPVPPMPPLYPLPGDPQTPPR